MIHYKSKPDDILYYISQLELVLLSSHEQQQINQIIALENLIKDESMNALIAEDLKDETWINDTQILINTCYKKIEKTLLVQDHIDHCRNFIVYRFLEDKSQYGDIEIFRQIGAWNFNEIDKHEEKTRWVSQKFIRAFEQSSVDKIFENFMGEKNVLRISLSWLHNQRSTFYSEKIFKNIKQIKSSQPISFI